MSPGFSTRETRDAARELKFLVTPDMAARIAEWSRSRLVPDPYATGRAGDYQITSLYFDTAHLDVYHRRGSFARSKYRIRRYGSSDVVFLERKLRTASLLTKRRTVLTIDELSDLYPVSSPDLHPSSSWFHERLRLRQMQPSCQVSYARIAMIGMTPYGPIRLTIDSALEALSSPRLEFSEERGTRVLESRMIVELKFRLEMPAMFKHLVEEFAILAEPVSKYRLAIDALRRAASSADEVAPVAAARVRTVVG